MYHYTSKEAFLEIIRYRKIWATNILYLNDSAEARYCFKVFNAKVKELLDHYSFGLDPERIYLDEASRWIDDIDDRFFEISNFIVSFSKQRDILSQWRGYAEHAGGICIGFSKSYINSLSFINKYKLSDCVYDKDIQISNVEKIINKILVDYKHDNPDQKEIKDSSLNGHLTSLAFAMVEFAPIYKHGSFSEENECRIIIDGMDIKSEIIQYRNGASMVVPYIELELEPEGSGLEIELDEVIVGPTPHPEISKASVEAFLKKEGIKFGKVVNSAIPYRSW